MSESPSTAIFQSPLSAEDVGGEAAFGRLVLAASLMGQSVNQFAETAMVKSVMATYGISEQTARQLLSALECSSARQRNKA
jgi:hypothetical protein